MLRQKGAHQIDDSLGKRVLEDAGSKDHIPDVLH